MRYFGIVACAAMVAVGASSCQRLKNLKQENFTMTPSPLEVKRGDVEATVSVNFPSRYMKKKAQLELTPVLVYGRKETAGSTGEFQGQRVKANGLTVSYNLGGTYAIRSTYRYTEDMLRSNLVVRPVAIRKGGKKRKQLREVVVGKGVRATSYLWHTCIGGSNMAVAPDNFQRVISQRQEADIKFVIAQSEVRRSETSKLTVQDLIATLRRINDERETRILDAIEVSAYASPDGTFSFNERLAERRKDNSASYLKGEMERFRMKAGVEARYTAEDWDGFRQLVEQSNLQDKQVILSVLSMYEDPEEREAQIKNISEVFTEIKDGILPELRRARMMVTYEVIGRSDEQILNQFATDARQLSIEELTYGATLLMETPEDQRRWNEKIMELFPNDYRAYNNMAVIAWQEGDEIGALAYLEKAYAVKQMAPEANANLALLALNDGDTQKAEALLARAHGSANYNEVLGILQIANGNYLEAADLLEGSHTNNEALAQILAEDYAAATSALRSVKNPDAMTDYLGAVLGARMTDTNRISNGLRAAVLKDRKLADRARNDLEFDDYRITVSNAIR